MTLSFNGMAREELNEAADYYKSQRPGLGEEFLGEVEGAIGFLLQYPLSAPLVRRTIRKRVIHRFPYNIFYYIKSDELRIIAIAHHKRRPFYWRGRQ